MQRLAVLVCGLMLVGASLMSGCGTIAKATEKYGDTETTVPYTVEQVGPIAEAIVEGYGLKDVDAVITKVDAKITAANAEGKAIEVTITPAGRRTAKIAVSNGAGKDVAEQILAEIEAQLDSGEPVAAEFITEESVEEVVIEADAVEEAEVVVDEAVESGGGSGGDQLP
ncbi:MAG: hypothetical protein AAGA25_11210 [Planctomycetota bacterium]